MAATSKPALSGFARALIQHGHLKEADAIACTTHAGEAATAFILEVANRGLMSCAAMARFAAETFGYPLLDLAAFDAAMFAREAVDRKLLAKHQVAPLAKRQSRITLATADPSNLRALDEIRFQTGLQIELVIVEADKLKRAVEALSESAADTLKELTGEAFDMDLLQQDGPAQPRDEEEANEVDDAPVVKFIQKVLIDAINEGASDVHFEPYEKFYRIRVRTDGILRDIAQPPLVLKDKIAARIKVISRLDISEKRVPQDGRMKLVLSRNKAIDFRVSTLPTLHGEKIVMRILDPSSAMLGIDALGYDPEQREALLAAVERPYGMILVTGPTGSGKTVSL
ncbi:MAG TPA: ATPase, T2SS/T4P/T4SS family, partial [Thauera aminoaromatica]|nr:ATPase, T2SS/T4P/T4SS family [Thauera aminoaromatica]